MAAPEQHLTRDAELFVAGQREVGSIVAATREHLQTHREVWRPRLREENALDADWDWLADFEAIELPSMKWETYALVSSSGRAEGLMSIEHRDELLYVDRLAIAPWNRPPEREVRAVGPALFLLAVERSIGLPKYGGRLGLHSLEDPATLAFYGKMKMIQQRVDRLDGAKLRYFELSATAAKQLLQGEEV